MDKDPEWIESIRPRYNMDRKKPFSSKKIDWNQRDLELFSILSRQINLINIDENRKQRINKTLLNRLTGLNIFTLKFNLLPRTHELILSNLESVIEFQKKK